jgi:hypothetical protein
LYCFILNEICSEKIDNLIQILKMPRLEQTNPNYGAGSPHRFNFSRPGAVLATPPVLLLGYVLNYRIIINPDSTSKSVHTHTKNQH